MQVEKLAQKWMLMTYSIFREVCPKSKQQFFMLTVVLERKHVIYTYRYCDVFVVNVCGHANKKVTNEWNVYPSFAYIP